jgi:phosphoribosylamine--glycine ligase
LEHAVAGTLNEVEAEWDRRTALGVVMAAAGYPDSPRAGDVISGLPPKGDDYMVFHAGTRDAGREVATSGGRVLCVTALGDTVKIAQRRAYEIVDQIKFSGSQMRRDIGYRAIGVRK